MECLLADLLFQGQITSVPSWLLRHTYGQGWRSPFIMGSGHSEENLRARSTLKGKNLSSEKGGLTSACEMG